MSKHRKDTINSGVMVCPVYLGAASKERIGKAIITEGQEVVLVLDENQVGKSVAKLLSPGGGLPMSINNRSSESEGLEPSDNSELPSFTRWYNQNKDLLKDIYRPEDTIINPQPTDPTLF